MKIGCVFPHSEIGDDMSMVKDFFQTAEGLGYDHVLCIDHVLCNRESKGAPWAHYYTVDRSFHEPLTLFSYAACGKDTIVKDYKRVLHTCASSFQGVDKVNFTSSICGKVFNKNHTLSF